MYMVQEDVCSHILGLNASWEQPDREGGGVLGCADMAPVAIFSSRSYKGGESDTN
jgi:hypothetical protein